MFLVVVDSDTAFADDFKAASLADYRGLFIETDSRQIQICVNYINKLRRDA
jgi:hypothetical protein